MTDDEVRKAIHGSLGTTTHVLAMHDEAILVGGGDPTIRDMGLIDSATWAPANAYDSWW